MIVGPVAGLAFFVVFRRFHVGEWSLCFQLYIYIYIFIFLVVFFFCFFLVGLSISFSFYFERGREQGPVVSKRIVMNLKGE